MLAEEPVLLPLDLNDVRQVLALFAYARFGRLLPTVLVQRHAAAKRRLDWPWPTPNGIGNVNVAQAVGVKAQNFKFLAGG